MAQDYFFIILMISEMSLRILSIYFMLMILVYFVKIILIKKLCNTIDENLVLQNWVIVNKLYFGIAKTNYMIFITKRIDY